MSNTVQGYYSPSDIMAILNVSRTKALDICHMFERHGKLTKIGPKTLRVSVKEFDKWLKSIEGR